MQVKLKFNAGIGSRAADGYETGSEEESKVENAQFYFFRTDNGTYLGTSGRFGVSDGEQQQQGTTNSNINVERTVDVTVPTPAVVALLTDNVNVTVVAMLNLDDSFTPNTASYDAFRKEVMTKALDNAPSDNSQLSFMMSNSVFAVADTDPDKLSTYSIIDAFKTGVDKSEYTITSAAVYEKGKKPEDYTPVEIYVERVCSKVTLEYGASYQTDNYDSDANGIQFTVKGWGLNVLNTKYYAVKNLKESFDYPQSNYSLSTLWENALWNKKADYRSFWAVDPNYNGDSYRDDFVKINFENLTNSSEDVLYCLENTFSNKAQYRYESTTAVVLAQFTPKGETEGSNFIHYNGKYYSQNGFLGEVVGSNNTKLQQYYKSDGQGGFETLETADFTLTGTGEEVKITEGTGSYTIGRVGGLKIAFNITGDIYNNSQGTTTADKEEALKDILANVGDYTVYLGGYCYYHIPIRHFDDSEVPLATVNDDTQLGRYGIVRNHVYKLNINTITGVGDPVESKPVEPEEFPDDKSSYSMDVTINVLSWAVRSQSVDL